MIRSWRGLVLVGVLTMILGLLVTFPARVAFQWFMPTALTVSGIQGTVWAGNASEASVSGIYCQDILWRMNPLRLFAGEVSYNVSAKPVRGFVESDVSLGFGGVLSLSNLSAALPLDLIAGASGVRDLQGNASLTFERVAIVNGLATAADGTLQVANLIIPIISRDSLGGYKADFFTQNNGIAASIEDTDGVVDLAGSFLLRADRTYEFTGQVIAKPETPQALRQQLVNLPPMNSPGQKEIRLEGVF